jgi:hypothetical protein
LETVNIFIYTGNPDCNNPAWRRRMGMVNKLLSLFILLAGCSSDIAVTDRKETRVVVDSGRQVDRVGKIDILVVIDTSGSMSDNFSNIGAGMEELRVDIEGLTSEYQFGFITTDGQNLGFSGIYNSDSSAIDMLMAPTILPSSVGEAGFFSTYTFLTSEDGIEFIRDESDLLLFLISDEDEQSGISASIFSEWLYSVALSARHDVVSITQTEDSLCLSAPRSPEIGYKYIEIANIYGKSAIDICGDEWSVWLSESSFLTQRINSISLSDPSPVISSIVAYIDGEQTDRWEYSEGSNSVIFNFIPDYGSYMEVGYDVFI